MDAMAASSGQERADAYKDLPPDADPARPDPASGPGTYPRQAAAAAVPRAMAKPA